MSISYIIQIDSRLNNQGDAVTRFYNVHGGAFDHPRYMTHWYDAKAFTTLPEAVKVVKRIIDEEQGLYSKDPYRALYGLCSAGLDRPIDPDGSYTFVIYIIRCNSEDPSDPRMEVVDRWDVEFYRNKTLPDGQFSSIVYHAEDNPEESDPGRFYVPGDNEPSVFYCDRLGGAHPWIHWYIITHELEFTHENIEFAKDEKTRVIEQLLKQQSWVPYYSEKFPLTSREIVIHQPLLLGYVLSKRNDNPSLSLEEVHYQEITRRNTKPSAHH